MSSSRVAEFCERAERLERLPDSFEGLVALYWLHDGRWSGSWTIYRVWAGAKLTDDVATSEDGSISGRGLFTNVLKRFIARPDCKGVDVTEFWPGGRND